MSSGKWRRLCLRLNVIINMKIYIYHFAMLKIKYFLIDDKDLFILYDQ